jgi:hypothetical protein
VESKPVILHTKQRRTNASPYSQICLLCFYCQWSLAVVGISSIKTLFNSNPLIKLDGYYLLSDFLEIPNLRRKSFRSVGALVRQLVGRPFQSEGETKRERRIYLTYGIIAAGGLLILMGSLLVTAFRYLGDGSQPMILAVPVTAGLMIRGHRGSCAPLQERRIPTSPAMMI